MCHRDGYVIFQNSELICGNLDKKSMGSGSKTGLFYSLLRDNTLEVAAACMLRLSKFSARWLSTRGFSLGISDVTPFPALKVEKARLLRESEAKCKEMIDRFHEGTLELKAGCDAEQSLEDVLNGELGKIREQGGAVLRAKLPRHNTALTMSEGGSKGTPLNMGQMIAVVGQ